MAVQHRAAEREAKENLLDRQAVLIAEHRKVMVSMHKEQQETLVSIARLERRRSGKLRYNDDKQEGTRTTCKHADPQEGR